MPDSGITKNALSAALKALMCEKPLAKISVGDICTRCGMNRKSFYYHFKDKYDLVNWIFYTEFFDLIQKRLPAAHDNGWAALLCLCQYFADHKDFYRNALSVQGQNSFYEYFGDTLAGIIRPEIVASVDETEYGDFYTFLFVDAFRCVILRWLTEGAKIPPEEFVRLLHNAILGLGHRVLKDENPSVAGESE